MKIRLYFGKQRMIQNIAGRCQENFKVDKINEMKEIIMGYKKFKE